ncbi:MAG: hypothetical protein WC508_03140 [Patescibacteria group bacterium]
MNAHQRHIERRLRQRRGDKFIPAYLMPNGDPQKRAVKVLQKRGQLTTESANKLLNRTTKRKRRTTDTVVKGILAPPKIMSDVIVPSKKTEKSWTKRVFQKARAFMPQRFSRRQTAIA